MRRVEFEINDLSIINEVLESGRWGDLALINDQGFPIIKPMNYHLENGHLYIHGANDGEKFQSIHSKASFMVVDELSYIPGDWLTPSGNPASPTCFFRTVLIKGHFKIVDEPIQKSEILNRFCARYQSDGKYKLMTPTNPGLPRVLLAGISLENVTCKCKLGQNLGISVRKSIYEKLILRNGPFDQKSAHLMESYGLLEQK